MKTMDFNKLVENAQKAEPKAKKEFKADERYFTVQVNKDGVMPGVIRFIAPKEEDDTFFTTIYSHFFKVGSKKFFSGCLTTLGQDCPVCEYNKEHWNEYSKQEQMDRKRKLKYTSNIYVVSDPGNPAREGKVFLWAYGISVYKKIMNMIAPPVIVGAKPKKPYNIFDEKTGKDFELMVTLKDGNNNYDECAFSSDASELCDGDEEKLKGVKDATYSLKDALKTETDKMKSYDEIKKWLLTVITGQKPSNDSFKSESKTAEADLWPTDEKKETSNTKPLDLKPEAKEPTKPASTEEEFFNFET